MSPIELFWTAKNRNKITSPLPQAGTTRPLAAVPQQFILASLFSQSTATHFCTCLASAWYITWNTLLYLLLGTPPVIHSWLYLLFGTPPEINFCTCWLLLYLVREASNWHRTYLGIAQIAIAPSTPPQLNGHSGALHIWKKCSLRAMPK